MEVVDTEEVDLEVVSEEEVMEEVGSAVVMVEVATVVAVLADISALEEAVMGVAEDLEVIIQIKNLKCVGDSNRLNK